MMAADRRGLGGPGVQHPLQTNRVACEWGGRTTRPKNTAESVLTEFSGPVRCISKFLGWKGSKNLKGGNETDVPLGGGEGSA